MLDGPTQKLMDWDALTNLDGGLILQQLDSALGRCSLDIARHPVPGPRTVKAEIKLTPEVDKARMRLTGNVDVEFRVYSAIPKKGGWIAKGKMDNQGNIYVSPNSPGDPEQITVWDVPGVEASADNQ